MVQVILGITGGVSAFKSASLLRLLTESQNSVKVIPTQNALRFIGSTTLEALSHNTVDENLFADVDSVKHISLAQQADIVVVAPATAAFLARFANGIADDLLLNVLLATKAQVLVVPAMHTEMWQNPATAANVETLRSRGVFVMEPDEGRLTGSDSGKGRLPEPEAIFAMFQALVASNAAVQSELGALRGKRLLITAGGTREPIDPVRYLANHSSGKQGIALAYAAKAAGAKVTLIAANIEANLAGLDEVVAVETASEMQDEVQSRLSENDAVIMAAAVADFRLSHVSDEKIKRGDSQTLELKLVANADILKTIGETIAREKLSVATVGFAAETAGSLARLASLAEVKLTNKKCDLLVANDVTAGKVFGSDSNEVYVIGRSGHSFEFTGTKAEVAARVLGALAKLL